MVIPHPNQLKQNARQALSRGREPRKVVLGYTGITTLIVFVLTFVNYWLGQQIDQTGGLSNLGTRSILSTAQTILPIVQMVVLLCLEMGYIYGMMRIARGQYADQTDLKVGFQRFGPLLRMTLLQALLYFGVALLTFYISLQIYLISPWSENLIELLLPFINNTTDIMSALDDAAIAQATQAMIPMFIMYLVIYLACFIPISYRFRMAQYSLLDHPQAGGFAAMRASGKMMRRNCMKLIKLDLSFWWYYLLSALVSVIAYGDVILSLLGLQLPFNATVGYFLFYILYLAALFAVNYLLRNKVELTYIMAYESIREKPQDSGVVLGNIFDM